jgi:hypothetical protein
MERPTAVTNSGNGRNNDVLRSQEESRIKREMRDMNKTLIFALPILLLSACGKESKPRTPADSSAVPAGSSAEYDGRGCALKTPVVLPLDPLQADVTYYNVELEHPIRSRNFELPANKRDLKLRLFNIGHAPSMDLNWGKTGFLGFELENAEASQFVGFPDVYAGDLDASGIRETQNDYKAYTTSDPQRGINLQVITSQGNITAVRIMIDGIFNCVTSMTPF